MSDKTKQAFIEWFNQHYSDFDDHKIDMLFVIENFARIAEEETKK